MATPVLVLALWAGGIAAGGALVASWRVVGPGYLRLTGGVVVALGVLVGAAGGGGPAYGAVVVSGLVIVTASRHRSATVGFGIAALLEMIVAVRGGPLLPALTGTVLLGGITAEMMLGHWYLVDPRLPRWPLRVLDAAGGAGLLAEVLVVLAGGGPAALGAGSLLTIAYLALAGFTGLLAVAVWWALREPGYTGVMAATGLSYLAVLTAFGVVASGRAVLLAGR